MYKIKVEFPITKEILETYAQTQNVHPTEALKHFQTLIQNAIDSMTPTILLMLEKAEATANANR